MVELMARSMGPTMGIKRGCPINAVVYLRAMSAKLDRHIPYFVKDSFE